MNKKNQFVNYKVNFFDEQEEFTVECYCGRILESTMEKIECPDCHRIWQIKIIVKVELVKEVIA